MKNHRNRQITFAAAIREATEICLKKNPRVILIGEGVLDRKGIFGTTLNLQEQFGRNRIFDMPVSENGMTGIAIGAAICGFRPIMVHQRIDFTLLAADQIINNAAKWHYMFGGKVSVPLVIRMLIGRGWGQGAQHSQSLQALYAHIPGLIVVMPSTPNDAKGLLIAAVENNNPVLFIEHRWLYNWTGTVPKNYYQAVLGKAKVRSYGDDITVVATSYMTLESLRAKTILQKTGISVEVIDARSIKPIDIQTIIRSVKKTGRLIVVDTGYKTLGLASEIIALVSETCLKDLKAPPKKITLPDSPTPTSWKAAENYYPTYMDITKTVFTMMDMPKDRLERIMKAQPIKNVPSDVPDVTFRGPF